MQGISELRGEKQAQALGEKAEKWTPDEWRIVESNGGRGVMVRSENCTIAEISANISRRSNAHLIAAAPELYEALEAVRPYFDGEHHPDHPHCKQMRAALARARGEQP